MQRHPRFVNDALVQREVFRVLPLLQLLELDASCVLEIASGLSQHAKVLAGMLPQITFQPSDGDDDLVKASVALIQPHPQNLSPPLHLPLSLLGEAFSQALFDAARASRCILCMSLVSERRKESAAIASALFRLAAVLPVASSSIPCLVWYDRFLGDYHEQEAVAQGLKLLRVDPDAGHDGAYATAAYTKSGAKIHENTTSDSK